MSNFKRTVTSVLRNQDAELNRLIERHNITFISDGPDGSFLNVVTEQNVFLNNVEMPVLFGSLAHAIARRRRVIKRIEWVPSEDGDDEPPRLPCPFCKYDDFVNYPQPGTFSINGVVKAMPTFVVCDRRKPFRKNGVISWFMDGKKYVSENKACDLSPIFDVINKLECYFDDINDIRNQSFYTIGSVFTKLLENNVLSRLPDVTETNIKQFRDMVNNGNIDSAISRTTKYVSSELGANNHYVEQRMVKANRISTNSKAVVNSGWFQKETRYREMKPWVPAYQLSQCTSVFRLLPASAKNIEHKIIRSCDVGILAVDYTTDGENCGRNLQMVPGVWVTNRTETLSVEEFTRLLLANDGPDRLTIVDGKGRAFETRVDLRFLPMSVFRIAVDTGKSFDFHQEENVALYFDFPSVCKRPLSQLTVTTENWVLNASVVYVGRPILSVIGNTIKFINASHAPKVVSNISRTHQVGFKMTPDTEKVYPMNNYLYYAYPQNVTTRLASPEQLCHVLCINFFGYNIEDGFVFNKSSVDRGLGATIYDQTLIVPCKSRNNKQPITISTGSRVVPFRVRKHELVVTLSNVQSCHSYNYVLNEREIAGGCGFELYYEDPYTEDDMTITSVENAETVDGAVVIVRTSTFSLTVCGDKWSTAHGQKGIVNKILPAEDLPFLNDPRFPNQPDILINYASFKRLTQGQLLEGLAGNVMAETGSVDEMNRFSGERYIEDHVNLIDFENCNSDRYAVDVFDPFTGERINRGILMLIPFHRLVQCAKRCVFNTNVSTRNNRCPLTGHIKRGKSKDGTMVLSVMDAINMINHGSGALLHTLQKRTQQPSKKQFPETNATFEVMRETFNLVGLDLV